MQASLSTLSDSTPDTAVGSQLRLAARQACREAQIVTAQPPPALSRLQRLVSWLGVLVCGCPACRIPAGKQSETAWHYF